MSARLLALSVLAFVVSSALARAQVVGPMAYTSTASSPWTPAMFQGYFHRETCEDGLINVPGLGIIQGSVFGPSFSTDSVDGDDGAIDGSGLMGSSHLVAGTGNPVCLFSFNAAVLGSLPTHAGIVVTDAHNPVFVEGFAIGGASLGIVTLNTFGAAPDVQGQTGEDRFVGYVNAAGISALRISTQGGGGLELDHLQYGHLPPIAGTTFCPGDGTGTQCPCGNSGGAASGCANSVNPAGGVLTGSGIASVSADTLVLNGSGMTNSSALYFQGTQPVAAGNGAAFGDGLRCAGGMVKRLKVATNTNGASSYPAPGQPSVSTQGGVAPATSHRYQVWYRDANPTYCTPATYSLTNGLQITWGQ